MYDSEKRVLSEQLSQILSDIEAGDLSSAIAWCNDHKSFYATTPHSSSSLPYHLHEAMFRSFDRPLDAILYARQAGMHEYLGTQPIGPMLTSCLFKNPSNTKSPYHDEPPPLAKMFRDDFCRFHGWAREEPLEVVANLGSRGGALNAIEKARRVMGERLGNVRTWPELPVGSISSSSDPTDGSPTSSLTSIPFGLCLSCVKGTGDRFQSAQDASVRTCHRSGLAQPSFEGRVGSCTSKADSQTSRRKMSVLSYGDITDKQSALVLLTRLSLCYSILVVKCIPSLLMLRRESR